MSIRFKPLIKIMALVIGMALVIAACGSDSDDDAATEVTTSAPASAPEEVNFGNAPWPCSPGDASGATAQGVTDDKIIIGGGDDRGFPTAPGLNKEQTDAVAAFVDECNRLGGINGRELEFRIYDAAILNVGQVITEACEQVFMLVGSGFSLDGAAEPTRVDCNLGAVPAWAVSADFGHGPNQVTAVPNPSDEQALSQASIIANVIAPENNIDISQSAGLWANYAATEETWEKVKLSYEANYDYDFVVQREYNINGEEDWTPWILALKEDNVEHVTFSGSCLPNYQALRQSGVVNDLDPNVIWSVEANFYETRCAAANVDGAMDNTYIRMAFTPFEEANSNPAVAEFIRIVEASGADTALLGMQAVSSFLLWATAAKACGSDLTQECIFAELEQVNSWDGHGMHVETDPAGNRAARCGMLLKLEGTNYVRAYPAEPATFACNEDFDEPDWRAATPTPAVEAAQLNEERVSTKYLE